MSRIKATHVHHDENNAYMDVDNRGAKYNVHRPLNDYGNHYWKLGITALGHCNIAGFRQNKDYERAYRLYMKRNNITPKDEAPKHWGIKLNSITQ